MRKKESIISFTTIMVYIAVGITALGLQVLFIDRVPDYLIAILPTVYWISVLIFSPLWGMLADSIGAKKLILVLTTSVSSIILFLHAILMQYFQIVILRLIYGLFLSAFLPVSLSILLENTTREEAGKKASIFTFSRSLGFLLSGYIASLILLFFAVRELFIFGTLFVGISALALIFIENNAYKNQLSESPSSFGGVFKIPGRDFIARNNGHLLVIALVLRHTNIMSLNALMFVYMLRKGIPDYLLGTISSFNTLVQVTLMYPLGLLSDKIGRKPLFIAGFTLSTLVPILFILANDPLSFSISFVLIGLSFSTLISGVAPFFKDIAPKGREAEALSFLNVTRSIGSIIGPIFAALLVAIGGYELMFTSMAIITAIATVLSFFAKETIKIREINARKAS